MLPTDRRRLLLSAGSALLLGTKPVLAQESPEAYPSKPVRFIMPFAAGGALDQLARRLGQQLAPVLGQQVVVENRPGAGGNIGAQVAARSAPDGYTLLVGAAGTNVVNQFLYPSLPFDPVADFIPITVFWRSWYVLVVAADSPVKTLADLIERAKRNPGKLNQALTAIGGPTHLGSELFKRVAGVDVVGVSYNGAGPATLDMLAGRVDFMLDTLSSQLGNIQAGKVRALAITGESRSADLPGVPAIAELFPGYSVIGWGGLFAPARTPQPIVDKVFTAVRKAVASPEFQGPNRRPGDDFVASASPQDFAAFLDAERAKWGKVIRDANIKIT